jgi:glutaredoxin-like YruB-family protein
MMKKLPGVSMGVKIYSTPMCPYCIKAKELLKQNGIPFEDINVSKDRKAAVEMFEKSGQTGVPVLDINGKIIIGFDKEAIKKELNIK